MVISDNYRVIYVASVVCTKSARGHGRRRLAFAALYAYIRGLALWMALPKMMRRRIGSQ